MKETMPYCVYLHFPNLFMLHNNYGLRKSEKDCFLHGGSMLLAIRNEAQFVVVRS